ncbi:transposase [Streptomyces sp. NPDC126522]
MAAHRLAASVGRSVNSVAKWLGVTTDSLRKWVRTAEASQVNGGNEPR